METKKILAILVLVVVILGGVFVFMRDRNKYTGVLTNKQAQTQTLAIKDQKITDNTAPFKIEISYPQIDGLDAFNKLVKDSIDKDIADFKSNSLANDKAVKDTDPVDYAANPREYDLQIGYDKGEIDQDTVSVVLNAYSFEGGAHGGSFSTPINYNVKTQKEITLADVFAGKPDYLKTISAYCIADLKKQISKGMEDNGEWVSQNADWLNEGAGPNADNYQVFLLKKDSITFYFGEYQVAPYSSGSFMVTMPK